MAFRSSDSTARIWDVSGSETPQVTSEMIANRYVGEGSRVEQAREYGSLGAGID